MAVFVFYRIPLDFLQKEWMYRGVMLRIMSPGRFCLQGRAYRFHPVSMREAWQVCFVRSFRNSKCGFPPFGPAAAKPEPIPQPVGSVSDTANPNASAFGFVVSDVAIYLYTTSAASGFSKARKSWSCPSFR